MSTDMKTPHCLVFDSGMGGLTIVRSLQKMGFEGRLSYAADTGFFPYGDKSDADLTRRIPKFASALIEHARPDIFVIACNTASTLALSIVREIVDIPVVGTVPAIKPAANASGTGVIGVLATPGTLRRAYTDALVHEFARHLTVRTHGSVILVEQAEEVAAGEMPDMMKMRKEVEALTSQPDGDKIDTVVLACTHFPLIRNELQSLFGKNVLLIDSGDAIARRTLSLLNERPKQAANTPLPGQTLYLSPTERKPERLIKVAQAYGFETVETVELD